MPFLPIYLFTYLPFTFYLLTFYLLPSYLLHFEGNALLRS